MDVCCDAGVRSGGTEDPTSWRRRWMPLIVLTAERGNSEGWMAAQNETVKLSTNSLHRVVSGATHASFVENPEHAAAITKAIHDVVVSAQTGEPLKGP